MEAYKHILCAVGFSPLSYAAARRALLLSGEHDARLGCQGASLKVLFSSHAAWHEIIRYAGSIDADVIVMGCHGHHGVASILGSTANGSITHAPCDVLAVRPRVIRMASNEMKRLKC